VQHGARDLIAPGGGAEVADALRRSVKEPPLRGVLGPEEAHRGPALGVERVQQLSGPGPAREAGDGESQDGIALGHAPQQVSHEARAASFLLPAVLLMDLQVPVAHLLPEGAVERAHGCLSQLQVEVAARQVGQRRGRHGG